MSCSSNSKLQITYTVAKYQKLGEMMLEIKQSSKSTIDNEKPYKLKVGDTKVFFEYSNNNKTFKECILNILKQKVKR